MQLLQGTSFAIAAAALLATIGLAISLGNWWAFYQTYISKRRFVSAVPLLGGLTLAASLLLWLPPSRHAFAVAPLLLDWGSLPVALLGVLARLRARQ